MLSTKTKTKKTMAGFLVLVMLLSVASSLGVGPLIVSAGNPLPTLISQWKFDATYHSGNTFLKDEVKDAAIITQPGTVTTSTRSWSGVGTGGTTAIPTLVASRFGEAQPTDKAMQFTRVASPTTGTTGSCVALYNPTAADKARNDADVNAFAVSVWFKRNSGGAGIDNQIQTIASKGAGNRDYGGWTIEISATGYLYVRAATKGATDGATGNATDATCAGQTFATNAIDYTNWHNVIMVIEKDAITGYRTIKGYLDGSNTGWVNQLQTNGDLNFNVISADNIITDTNVISSPSFPIAIGSASITIKNKFNGLMDDMRVYGGVLDQEQINTINGISNISTNANLSTLVPSTGTLSPSFASGTINYSMTVSSSTSSIQLTPTVTDTGKATVKVNGVTTTSGSISSAISLNVGSNSIPIVVTAEDGITTKTYTVVVNVLAIDLSSYNVSNDKIITNAMLNKTVADWKTSLNKASGVNIVFNKETDADIVGTGTTIAVTANDVTTTYTVVIYGDIDGNGAITIEDLTKIKSVLLKSDTISGAYLAAGDFSKKGSVSISDLIKIKKHLIGVSTINQNS